MKRLICLGVIEKGEWRVWTQPGAPLIPPPSGRPSPTGPSGCPPPPACLPLAGNGRSRVPPSRGLPGGFRGVSASEAARIRGDARALAEGADADELTAVLDRLAGTVLGLAAELELRDNV